MRSATDASKAVCRICGEVEVLDTDARLAAAGLSAFTTAHSVHDRFRIDVVTGPLPTESRALRLPLQRESGADDGLRSA